jgi:hypothetical protein
VPEGEQWLHEIAPPPARSHFWTRIGLDCTGKYARSTLYRNFARLTAQNL